MQKEKLHLNKVKSRIVVSQKSAFVCVDYKRMRGELTRITVFAHKIRLKTIESGLKFARAPPHQFALWTRKKLERNFATRVAILGESHKPEAAGAKLQFASSTQEKAATLVSTCLRHSYVSSKLSRLSVSIVSVLRRRASRSSDSKCDCEGGCSCGGGGNGCATVAGDEEARESPLRVRSFLIGGGAQRDSAL